jgi:hypothetical protein
LHFHLYALRFQFAAHGRLKFRAGQAVNLVRGALGAALRKISCPPECTRPGDCPQQSPGLPNVCSYHRLFEPHANGSGPSGLADWPRPFVLRAAHLEGATIAEGAAFHIGVHLFDLRPGAVPALEAAFAQWGRDGIGPERTAAVLTSVEGATQPLELMLDSSADPVRRITVHFRTPTELKGPSGDPPESQRGRQHGKQRGLQPGRRATQSLTAGAGLPPFELLAVRIRDRLSTLRALYGEGPLAIDFRGFAERASRVRTIRGEVREVAAQRRSRRTGQTHSLGGFVGEVEYEGDLAEFLPYLRAAAFTGVGRQTVWGKGEIRLDGSMDSVD